METLKSLLNQRDGQDAIIAKCNLQIAQYDLNIKTIELKIEQMRKTQAGNEEAKKRATDRLTEAQLMRDALSMKIENFGN